MKSPKKNGIGEVVTDYGRRVMRIFKKGLLQRSLFDFYGDIKADSVKIKESSSVPGTPVDGDGGVVYIKSADGKLYFKSNEVSEVELSSSGATLTTEQVQDIVGAMFTSNTETRISATYEDSDGTIDLVVDDMTADTNTNVGNADMTLSGTRNINTSDNTFQIKNGSTVYLEFDDAGITTLIASSDLDIGAHEIRASKFQSDVTTGTAPLTVASTTAVANLQAATATTLHTARNIGGVSFNGSANIDLPGVNSAGNQNTSGNAATATLATNAQGIAGATDADVNITSDGEVIVKLDSDNDESTQKFKVTNNADTEVAHIDESGNLQIDGDLTVSGSGTTSIGGTLSCADLDITGSANALTINSTTGNVAINASSTDADCILRLADNSTAGTNIIGFVATGDDSVIRNDEGNFKVNMANNATTTLDLDQSGNLTVTGIITGKQREIYSQSFTDDLGTSKHFIPWKDINEQTTIYQEEAAMLMPCDGRIVSVTLRTSSITGSGNMTIGVNTIAPNINQFSTSNWTEEETETLAITSTDDYHVFHFAFSNAKHFDSGDLVTISIQNDADLSSNTFWYVSTVVEYNWATYLGTTSAEYDSNP